MKYSLQRPRQSLSLDGVQRTVPAASRQKSQPLPQAKRYLRPFEKHVLSSRRSHKRGWQVPYWLQMLLVLPLLMLVSFFIQSAALGQLAIIVYGVVAFLRNIPSRTTFSLALVSMITTTILLVVRGNLPLAQNFATYTFLFLVVGVFTLSRELKKEGGRIYSNRQNK